MKETLVQVQRTVMRDGKSQVEHYWVKPDQVKAGDLVIVPPTTDYHINKLDYNKE